MAGYSYNSFYELKIEEVEWKRWQKLVNTIATLFETPVAFINQASRKGIEVLVASELPTTHYSPGGSADMDENVYCHTVVRQKAVLYVQDARLDRRWDDNPEVTGDDYISYLGFPILWPDGQCFGTLCVMDTRPVDYERKLFDVMEVLCDTISADLGHIYKENQLKIESCLDPLTSSFNRRGFEEIFAKSRKISAQLYRSCQLLFIDLDGFKQINDTLGHEIGDKVLVTFARALRSLVRDTDVVARWGGDEFVILLNSEVAIEIKKFCSRLNQVLKQESLETNVGYSLGHVDIKPDEDKSLHDYIEVADQAMYHRKQMQQD